MAAPGFLRPALEWPIDRLVIRHEPSGRIVANRLETAFDSASRRRGLLGRTALDRSSALIIAPCSGVHTFHMAFPIDIVFVDRLGGIIKVSRSVPAWRIRVAVRAHAVVELAAGTLHDDIGVGDRLSIAAR